MMRKFIIILLFTITKNFSCQQPNVNNAPNLPTSPEVARMMRFGDIPVNNFSGSIAPSIPIYTIKREGIEIPINLTYTSSGIRLEDQATWVGLGWEISPIGTIVQEVRGKNDNYSTMNNVNTPTYQTLLNRLGALPPLGMQKAANQIGIKTENIFCHFTQGQFGACVNDDPVYQIQPEDSDMVIVQLDDGEGQPDIYSFSFLGYQGDFYINPNTSKITFLHKQQNVTWEMSPNTLGYTNYSFTATTGDGTKYFFYDKDKEEIKYQGFDGTEKFNNYSYKLSKIVMRNGEEINFEYEDAIYNNIYYGQTNKFEKWGNSEHPRLPNDYLYNPPTSNNYSSNVKILKKIVAKDVTIVFNLTDRQDIISSSKPLKKVSSIDIIANLNSQKIKSYFFDYDYFQYSNEGLPRTNPLMPQEQIADQYVLDHMSEFGKRLKLNRVTESFYKTDATIDTESNMVYKFDYNTKTILPIKVSFSKDFWGFYNGSSGVSLNPQLDYFLNTGYNLGLEMHPSYNGKSNNKFSDIKYFDAYMLKKITYPTGGYTFFEYEPNKFTGNSFIPNMQQLSNIYKNVNLNNNGISNITTSNPSYSFTLPPKTPSGKKVKFVNEIYKGVSNSPLATQAYTYNQLINANAKIVLFKKNGSVETEIKKWDLTSVTLASFDSNPTVKWEETLDLEPGDYRVYVNIDNSMYATNDAYHLAGVKSNIKYYDDPISTESTQLGARIKNVKSYNSNNALISQTNYTYQGGLLNNKFEFATPHLTYEFLPIEQGASEVSFMPKTYYYYLLSGSDIGNSVTYSTVTKNEINVLDNTSKGSIEYQYYNLGNSQNSLFPILKNPMNGLLVGERTKDNNGGYLRKVDYEYLDYGNHETFLSVQAYNNYLYEEVHCKSKNNGNCFPKHTYYITPLVSDNHKIKSKKITEYLNGKPLTTLTNYSYNPSNILSMEETTYPDSTIEQTKYVYAIDEGNTSLIEAGMTEVPRYIEKTNNIGGVTKTISLVETKYAGPTYKPTKVLSYLPDDLNQSTTEISYDKYDLTSSNLLQYTGKDGLPVVILWSNSGLYPIAKIAGATYPNSENPKLTDIPQTLIDNLSTGLISLEEFRNNPSLSNFQVTTYTYYPLIGIKSITPPSGIKELYNYDSSHRLQSIVDMNGKILKEFKYNYNATPLTLYSNIEKSQAFTKNNCTDGYIGNSYLYNVQAGSYTSSVSQADADNLAQNDIILNGQTAANTYGTCSPASIITGTFTSNTALSLSSFNPLFSNSSSQGNLGKLVITFNTSSSYAWTNQTLIGSITSNCTPSVNRSLNFTENGRTWALEIRTNGEVYLKFISGTNFYSNTTISLNIQYQK